MEKADRKPVSHKRATKQLQELQHTLLGLHDELTETIAWTALLYDGLCGLMAEQAQDIDTATHTGMRFATIWIKQRNLEHANKLQSACTMLRKIRG